MRLSSRTHSASALALFARRLGQENWAGVQGEAVRGALPTQVRAVACDQLPGHEHEDLVDVLGLLGGCLQNGEEAVLLSQRAGVLKQHVPFFPQVAFVPWG